MDNEDGCFEFRQERDLMYRTHLYYLDYKFPQVSRHTHLRTDYSVCKKKQILFLFILPLQITSNTPLGG